MMKNLFNSSTNVNRQSGKSYSSDLHSENNSILFSPQIITTMEKSYNLSGSSSPSRTEPVEVRTEQCLNLSKGVEVRTDRTQSLSKGSSPSFFKSFALALAMFVVGIGSSWGQCTNTFATMLPATVQNPGATITTNTGKYFAVNVTSGTVYKITSSLGGSAFNIRMGSATGAVIWTGVSGSCFTAPSTGVAYVHHSTSACATTTNTTARTITFVTQACTSTFSSTWTENFDALGATSTATGNALLPCGWSKTHGEWATSNAAHNTYNDPRSASYYLTNVYTATNETVFTRGFDLTAGVTYTFEFYYAGDGFTGWTGDVIYNTQQAVADATVLGASFVSSATTTTANSYTLVSRTFTPSTNGRYFFGVRINANGTPWYLGFDDFSLSAVVPCSGTPAPGNTISSSATVAPGGTVNLSLQTATSGTGVTYQWQSAPTSTGTWTNFGTSSATQTSPAINANTWFRCRVTCGANTGVSNPVQVTLAACTPTATSDDATGITFVGFNTISNASVGTPAYTNNTGISTSIFQNTAYPLTVRVNTAGAWTVNVLAWIDWNQNLTFEAGEQYNLGSANNVTDANTTASPFSITVPGTALLGNTIMRVRATYNVAPTACGDQAYSEAEDYTINVQAIPLATCPTLTSPANAATGVSLTPTLTWTAGANTSSYDVYLSTNQTDVNNQAAIARVSTSQAGTSYTSSALTPSTTYYWRIVPKNSFGTAATGCTTQSFTTTAPTPTISQSGTLSAFSACQNVASAQQSFSVSGLYLSGNLVVTAPTGFSVSTTSGSGWASSVSLTPAGGTVSSTLIYVRMNALASNPTAANVVCSSTSASSVNVAVSGSVIAAPTVNAGSDFNLCSGQNIVMNASTNATGPTLSATANSGTVTLSGNDDTNPTATYTFSGLPAGALITGITVNISSAGGFNCPSWYSVTTRLNGVQQGVAGCATNTTYTNLNGQAANGLVVAVRGQDNDLVADFMTITYTVSLNYTYVGDPTYAWSPATGLSASNVLNPTCSTSSTQTYTLTVTGGNGCSASDQVVATVAGGSVPSAPTASVSGASTVNVGGTAILTSTAGANTVWYTTATGGTSVGSGSPFTTPAQCASGSVTYYAEENNGTCTSNSRGAVSFTVRPMLVSNPANALICQSGGSVTLSTQLTGATGISWSPNTNLSTTSGPSTVASPTTTTVYTMTATVAGCGAVSGTQTVGVIDAVAFTPTSTPASVCAGNTAALASNLASAGFTYSTMPFAPSTAVSPTILCNACGLDDGGWNNVPIPFTYNFFGNNYTSVNVGSNGVLQFGSSAGLGQFTYNSGNFPNVAYPPNVIAAAAVDLWLTSGIVRYFTDGIAPTRKFVIEYSAAAGYSGGSNTVQIKLCETTGIVEIHVTNASAFGGSANKVVGLQDLTQTIGATAYSNTATITNTAWKFVPGANYTFQWATAGADIPSATATTYTTPVLNAPGTVTYNVAATNPNTQCTTTQSVNITVNALPAAPISAGDVTACNTAANQNLVVSVGGGETADWYAATTGGTVLTTPSNGTGTLSYSVPATSSVTYYAGSRNTTTGCASASRTAVSFTANTSPSAPTASGATYCQGATPSALSASAPVGSNTQNWYTVSTGGTPLAGAPTPSTSTAGSTTYYVGEASGSNGCESNRTAVTVTVNATPAAPTASNPSAYCQNDAATALSATSDGSSTLYWYTVPTGGTGSTTAITPSTASSGLVDYYVSQMSASNCESSRATISVTVNPSITPSVASGASSTSACGGNAITFTATPTNGGTPTYQWYLNGNPVGSNSATYTTNQASDNAGNYSGTWNNGSNQGSGMAAWSFNVGANSGQFIGNPSNDGNGTAGIGSTAHGIYASGGGYINTTRGFTTPMQIGDELRFYWVFNWDANGGNKGFDLRSGGSTIFNVNNGGSAAITVTGGATADGAYGTTPMYVQVTRTSASQYTFSMTRRSDGSTYTTTFNNASAIDGVSFYIGGQNDGSGQRNLYFNGLEMRAPQANDQIYVAMTPSSQACLTSTSAVNSSTIALTSTASTPTVAIQSSASSAVCTGVPVTFSVNTSANMGSAPSYQWKLNGTNISGANSPTYASSALSNNDQISLEMTSSLSPACLTVAAAQSSAIATAVNSSTSITTQPAASSACASSSTNFTVVGAGQGTLTYQWKKNGVNITGNATATTSTLTLSGVSATDVADYTVVVTGGCGNTTSNVAAFALNPATLVTTQPTAVPQCTGTNATFTVAGTGHNALSYQWRFNGTAISGATNDSYTATNITSANAGQYSVVVTGGCGAATSSNAQLTVQPATNIATQPTASTICQNNTANFSVSATGQGSLSYQWKLDGNAIGGATSSTLAVSNAQLVNAGSYTVDVTGACGITASNGAVLTVNPATTISTQPVGTAGCEGQNTTFTVVAAGTGTLSYQWKYGSTNVGTNSASFNISSTSTANDGNYSVVVSGGCGNTTSSTVALNVYESPATPAVISTADLTDATLCGKNEVTLAASTPGAESTGEWSVVGNWGIAASDATNPNTTFIANNAALGGSPKQLVWSHVRANASGNSCYSSDTITVDFKQPSITPIAGVIQNGDVVWGGLSSADWSTSDNWYQYQSGALMRMTQGQPTSATKVYTLSNSVGGTCISSVNSVTAAASGLAANIYVGTGAALNLSNGSISLNGDLINNGTITPGTGTVTFNGSAAQKITGSGTVANLNNVIVNKTGGTLTLEQPTKVAGTLTMTQGDIITDDVNILEVGTSASSVGAVSWAAGTVRGPMKRWFAAATNSNQATGIFPVGANIPGKGVINRYAQVNFTSAPGVGGYVIAEYKTGTPSTGYIGLPITYNTNQYIQNFEEEGYWDITPYNASGTPYAALNTAPYTLKLRMNNPSTLQPGVPPSGSNGNALADISKIRIITSKGPSHNTWVLAGTQGAGHSVLASGDYLLEETGVTGFSFFNGGGNDNNPLPVELVSFSGLCEEGMINLTWQTASEFNSSHFDVEKSRDGENWQLLTTVPSAGTSNELITYQTVDQNGTNGNNYYRLRQVDNDGQEKVYDPINVSCAEVAPGYFSSFPNPSGTSFQVIVNNKELIGVCTLNMVDATGKVIEQREIEVKDGINMFVINQELTPGIYFLNITNGSKSTSVLRHAIK